MQGAAFYSQGREAILAFVFYIGAEGAQRVDEGAYRPVTSAPGRAAK